MNLAELSAEQVLELKQGLLTKKLGNPSYGELADADRLVTDDDLIDEYGETDFVEDDFMCSCGK